MYPVDGNGIPRLYVVRADGEKLYAAVGSLSGDKLPQMMLATLRQAGRSFSDAESAMLDNSVATAKSMLDESNVLAAAVALSAANNLGSIDNLASYAKPAIGAGELYEQLQAEIDKKIEAAESDLSVTSTDSDPLDAIVAIYEAEAAYKLFPKLKSKAATLTRDLKKQTSYGDAPSQADALVKARILKSSPNPRMKSRAPAAYTSVIRRFPGTRIDELARAELAELQPDAKVLQSKPEMIQADSKSTVEFRRWTAKSGNFSTTAKYLQQKSGKVQLQTEDGKKIVVDIAALSDEDQAYLKAQE